MIYKHVGTILLKIRLNGCLRNALECSKMIFRSILYWPFFHIFILKKHLIFHKNHQKSKIWILLKYVRPKKYHIIYQIEKYFFLSSNNSLSLKQTIGEVRGCISDDFIGFWKSIRNHRFFMDFQGKSRFWGGSFYFHQSLV